MTLIKTNSASDGDSQFAEALSLKIRQAVEQLAAGDFHSRWDAAKQFTAQFSDWGDTGDPPEEWPSHRIIPALIQQLQVQKDPDVQWFLVRILSQFEHPSIVTALAKLLVAAPSEELQQAASQALSSMGVIAIDALKDLLNANPSGTDSKDADSKDADPESANPRLLAARTLAHIRHSAIITPLLQVADDSDTELRAIAIEALGSFHDPRITPVLLSALTDRPSISIEAIRTLGRRRDLLPTTDLVSPLRQCLASSNEAIACESATALGRLGSDAAVRALGKGLAQPLPTTVRCAIARALGWLNLPAAVAYLADSFLQSEPFTTAALKQSIACALSQTRDQALSSQAAEPLSDWLSTNYPPSELSAEALRSPASPQSTALVQTVISALAQLGVSTSLHSLVPMLAHTDARLRMHALSALKQIDPRSAQQFTQRYLENTALAPAIRQRVQTTLAAW